MSLTLGTGPLANAPGGAFNFDLAGSSPKHRIFFADYPLRLRAQVGDRTVLDTTRAKLLYETNILPVPYAPIEDFDAALLVRTEHTTHCPFKGDASYWSVRAGDTEVENAVWTYADPLPAAPWLKGQAALYWKRATAWYVEEEPVPLGHLRDPFHRVDVHESSRPATVRMGDRVIAHSDRPKLLIETGLPMKVYVPRADVAAGVLAPAQRRTACPYKGEARFWDVAGIADGAWSYDAPLPEATKVQGHVSFDAEGIDVDLGAPRAQLTG